MNVDLNKIWENFNSPSLLTSWIPFIIIIAVVFVVFSINYGFLFRGKLMDKILTVHGFKENLDNPYNETHFHNSDTLEGNFKFKSMIHKKGFTWVGKKYLLIPNDKLNTLTIKRRKLTVWYKGYSSKGIVYNVKKIEKGWIKRKLSKKKIVNYNGTFIVGNLMVKTANLSSLRIDSRGNDGFTLTYLFDNGSQRIMKISLAEFFDSMLHNKIPYNAAFLNQCEVIELR